MTQSHAGSWFLGIDLGTSSCKTVVVDRQGQVLGKRIGCLSRTKHGRRLGRTGARRSRGGHDPVHAMYPLYKVMWLREEYPGTCMIGTSGALRVIALEPRLDPAALTWCYAIDADHWLVGGALSNGEPALDWLRRFLQSAQLPHDDGSARLTFQHALNLAARRRWAPMPAATRGRTEPALEFRREGVVFRASCRAPGAPLRTRALGRCGVPAAQRADRAPRAYGRYVEHLFEPIAALQSIPSPIDG